MPKKSMKVRIEEYLRKKAALKRNEVKDGK